METTNQEFYRVTCDTHFDLDPNELAPGGISTHVNFDGDMFEANNMAKKGLDIYNKKNKKNFRLMKVVKINVADIYAYVTFLAQDDGSGERNLFRCVVYELGDQVEHCEIKYVGDISLLVDHVEEYFQKVAERVKNAPSTEREDDLGDGCAAGSGVILVSPTMFRVMGEKLWSELHEMCDDYMDPCLYEKCGMMTGVYDGSFEWVKKYAILATDVYNQQEQKNFAFIKVERLYISDAYYCMTFWARNDKSDEYRLFRALVCFKDDAEEIFKYVQDDDEFTVFGEVDDAYSPEPCGSVDVLSPHMIEQVRI